MIKLPDEFTARMKVQLGEEFEAFMSCYESQGYAGLRMNTTKVSADEFRSLTSFPLEEIPWVKNGFYYDRDEAVTKHPHYFAGLYYIQEPSAMLPASRLPIEEGDVVLDLCAAPGGKATELSAKLNGTGMLVANDVSPSRAKALFKNLAVWGSPNCCITGETPEKLLETFGCSFDKILVDAPCSGEGMFRKDEGLITSWKERGPEYYAQLQKQILDSAVQMLKPGGMLLYSTCTFAKEEDEDVIAYVLETYPQMKLVQAEMTEGLVQGYAPYEKCLRVWPHKVRGEGHFLALLKKEAEEHDGCRADGTDAVETTVQVKGFAAEREVKRAGMAQVSEKEILSSQKKMPQELRDFLSYLPERIWKDYLYEQIGEQCLLVPPYKLPKKLRYLRTGVQAGTLKKGRFEPSQQLAMLLRAEDFPQSLSLPAEDMRLIRYLKGETVELTDEEEALLKKASKKTGGWVLICVDGFALGWGKFANGSIKNKYYPGWRLQ